MTFAHLKQATAASQRLNHQTRNTFNRIQNTFITTEIHEQGQSIGIQRIRYFGMEFIRFINVFCVHVGSHVLFKLTHRFVGHSEYPQ